MEISNEIMVGLIALIGILFKSYDKLVDKFSKKNGSNGILKTIEGIKTLSHEEHDWLKSVAEILDPRNPQSITNQQEEIKKICEQILEKLKFSERTTNDIWDVTQKLRRK